MKKKALFVAFYNCVMTRFILFSFVLGLFVGLANATENNLRHNKIQVIDNTVEMDKTASRKDYGMTELTVYKQSRFLNTLEQRNVAIGKVASQSSTYANADGPASASRAVDGITNGDFSSSSVSVTLNDNNPWWKVDLGGLFVVSSVRLYNRVDCCGDRLANAQVSLLDNNGNVIASETFSGFADVMDYSFDGVTCSEVKVSLTGTQYLQLAEVEVLSPLKKIDGTKDFGDFRCDRLSEVTLDGFGKSIDVGATGYSDGDLSIASYADKFVPKAPLPILGSIFMVTKVEAQSICTLLENEEVPAAPSCLVEIDLTYSNESGGYIKTGKIMGKGTGPDDYAITGGIGDFLGVSGKIKGDIKQGAFDPVKNGTPIEYNVAIEVCYSLTYNPSY